MGIRDRVAKCISWRGRDGGAGGVDDEELPRPEINLRQYFSSRSRCTHVLSAPVFSTPDIKRWRLWMMEFLSVCSTPLYCLLWLYHAVRSLVGS